jgi:uncharacterized phage protein (TIGR02218 family)
MKSASPAVQAILVGRLFKKADIYTLTLRTGTTLRWTGADVPVRLDGVTYSPVPIERSKLKWAMGVEVDNLTLTIYPPPDLLIEGQPLNVAARTGALDDAVLLLESAYITDFASPAAGALHQFEGAISVDKASAVEVALTVKSFTSIFNREVPIRSFTPGCGNTLYDTGCGVNREARALFGSVEVGSTRRAIKHSMTFAERYLDYGALEFTSGENAGVLITLTKNTVGTFNMVVSLSADVAIGDTFKVYPGCDRTLETCLDKFNNKSRFRGYPWIPKPETAY